MAYLDQHQTANNITTGLGPIRGPDLTRAILHSRGLAAKYAKQLTHERNLGQAITRDRVMRIR